MRLTLLLAAAAAFLLVPAAQALAAGGPEVEILTVGNGSGKVVGQVPFAGNPAIECNWNGTSQSGTCKTKASELEPGEPEEGYAAVMNHQAAAGSEFTGWKIEGGIDVKGCEQEKPEAGGCTVLSFGEKIIIKATFKKIPVTNVHIILSGKGSGEVLGHPGGGEGTPRVECKWNGETQIQSGTCNVEAGGPQGPFLRYIFLEELAAAGSNFKEWELVSGKGKESGEGCKPRTGKECVVGNVSGAETEIVVKAQFTPPPVPLTITKSGTGTGTVTSSPAGINCGGTCVAEFEKGTEVTLTPTAPAGSTFVEWTGACTGSGACVVSMSEAKSVNAKFDVETFALTLSTPGGHGSLSAECTPPGGSCSSLTAIPYGTSVKVTATSESIEYTLKALSGSGSAASNCNLGAGTCTFTIKANSEVSAEFASAAIRATQEPKVWGEVPQTTTLEATCPKEVYLGKFIPNLHHDETYAKTCGLTVTATGMKNVLTAADKTGEAVGRLGHLVQPSYSLAQPLETKATDTEGLGGISGTGGILAPLSSPVTLLSYATPVNDDAVTLEFSQLIRQHDPLHTGVYSKVVTLTLEQTEP
jgi:hypothetical protein